MENLRTPLDHLTSEALSVLRDSVGLFDTPALLVGQDSRSEVLRSLARLALGEGTLAEVRRPDGEHDAYLSPETGANFEVWPLYGKPPEEGKAWNIFPLASWSERDIRAYLGAPNLDQERSLQRMCVVGQAESGKSTLVAALMRHSEDTLGSGSGSAHHHLILQGQRYFLIDPPGEEPYSHGLLAAANSSDIAMLVVDAEEGLTTTTRLQAFVLALFGVPQIVVAVNRMDRVGYSQAVYEGIVEDLSGLLSSVELPSPHCLPLSAEQQQNLTEPSRQMSWYEGTPLLTLLQTLPPRSNRNLTDPRLPVQWADGTLIAGQIASGRIACGDRMVLLPQGAEVEIAELQRGKVAVDEAIAGDSVSLRFKDPIPVERGELLTTAQGLPQRSSTLEAIMVWLGREPSEQAKPYLLHHGPRLIDCHVSQVMELLDPESLSWGAGTAMQRGAIAKVRLTSASPIFFDTHAGNRSMGSFAILDRSSREVLGSGILRGAAQDLTDVTANAQRLVSDHVVIDPTLVKANERQKSYGHPPAVLWFTGLSGSGKSAVAKEVEKRLFEHGCHTLFLDGDNVRTGLNGDLGFTEEERTESNRRVAELAALAYEQGQIVICSFISGRAEDRAYVGTLIPSEHHLEFYVNCPIEVCRERDPKELYKKADAGELLSFSGISIPYDAPETPALELRSDRESPEELAERVWQVLHKEKILR